MYTRVYVKRKDIGIYTQRVKKASGGECRAGAKLSRAYVYVFVFPSRRERAVAAAKERKRRGDKMCAVQNTYTG